VTRATLRLIYGFLDTLVLEIGAGTEIKKDRQTQCNLLWLPLEEDREGRHNVRPYTCLTTELCAMRTTRHQRTDFVRRRPIYRTAVLHLSSLKHTVVKVVIQIYV